MREQIPQEYLGKGHRLRVLKPFYLESGILIPEGSVGTVLKGQDLYGYVTVLFKKGSQIYKERTVVTDYTGFVEDLDYDG